MAIDEVVKGYKIVKKLGEGRFGMVYMAINEKKEKVIIKQLKREMLLKQPEKIQFEANILKDLMPLNDPRFPKYIDTFKLKYRKGYILEYKEGKTIEEIIYKDNYRFSRKEIYDISLQLLDILTLLESHHIVHKDIRVSNVLLNAHQQLTLIDFGLARYIDGKKYKKDLDYWYLADFLIHLYYTSYDDKPLIDEPWYEQLDLLQEECLLLKRLMRIDQGKYPPFSGIDEIRKILIKLITQNNI